MLCADENFFPWMDICTIQINKYYYYYYKYYFKLCFIYPGIRPHYFFFPMKTIESLGYGLYAGVAYPWVNTVIIIILIITINHYY